jgi:antitoxin Phd
MHVWEVHPMNTTATDMKNRFGEFLMQAQREPITIQKSGQTVAVLLSAEEYDRLRQMEDAVWAARADKAMANGLASDEDVAGVLRRYNDER